MNIERYEGLYIPRDMLEALRKGSPLVDAVCNGVGPSGIINHFIPNTIWGLDITPSSDCHDWMYSYPRDAGASYKDEADRVFLNNMLRQIDRAAASSYWGWVLSPLRRHRAQVYYVMVRDFGGPSFWSDKNKTVDGVMTSRKAAETRSGKPHNAKDPRA